MLRISIPQTRGWFYTLTVLATALFDKPAFKNLIVNGLVLASDGRKMSKRLKNYPGESCRCLTIDMRAIHTSVCEVCLLVFTSNHDVTSRNMADPMKVIESHGADALRLYLINSPVVRAESLKFKEEGVQATVRDVLLPWFNAFRFFVQQVSSNGYNLVHMVEDTWKAPYGG